MSALLGKDVGMEIHRRRIAKWKKVSVKYSDHPKKIFGLSIHLNPSDFSPVSTSIGTDGVLDLPLTCLLIKFVKKGMNVVDAGANLGYFTLLSSKLVGELGTVYAFEPEEQNFKLLSRSVSENHLGNVRLTKQALSERRGRIMLFLGDSSHPHEHSIGVDRGEGSVEIDCDTLDDYSESLGKPRIDLIKIHVVGDDPLVLTGASKVINEMSPMIVMVYDPPKWNNEKTLLKELFERYTVFQIVESPALIRRVPRDSLNPKRPVGLFLFPRN